ncbi:flagellar assembly factor FliW [Clostridium punense]|uniref:Flagellar assembly factor FliW n=1 Tax=Clostridium punense TaxID=1054297 RepID=A0ABS4K227_9CLOT|nr:MULTISPECIES: flagellar assembly protein FliW [Clostridium]EQB88543.1 hypothetical protein M918_03875 [Clostridium sp. BL8]MBP2021833.1 flagellar assembly factor FliW [Clostridium punense]
MKLKNKFNQIVDCDEKDIIIFENGIFGFENLKKFVVIPIEENEKFKMLQSTENDSIGIVIVSPFDFKKQYEINLSDEYIEKLKIKEEREVLVYTTVTLNSDIDKITTNLKAPIIINVCNNLAMQIIMDSDKYKIKEPLFKE